MLLSEVHDMEYLSTRGSAERVSAAAAIARGLAGDGGLYVPDALPAVSAGELRELCALPYRERVERVIAPFLPEFTAEEVKALCAAAGVSPLSGSTSAAKRSTSPSGPEEA